MSSPKWTSAQQNAIVDDGGTLLISAAAGSGKTAVLVERAVRLLTRAEEPICADRLLIVTFTRAAAEELRARIGVRLAQQAAVEPENLHLRRQILLLGRANISTIDAFCMQLLQRYFSELDLPPDFGLADDALSFSLRQTALAEVLEQLYEDEAFCDFASLYGRARSDTSAAAAVLSLYDFLRSLPHPEKALEQICQSYESTQPLPETPWGIALLAQAQKMVENALQLERAARALVAEEPALANYDAALADDSAFLERILELIVAARWDDTVQYAGQFTPTRFKALRGYEGTQADTVKNLREAAKDTLKQLQEKVFVCTQAEFEQDRSRIAPMLRALGRGVQEFESRFYAAKLAEKVLEYSDFEHLALRLLCDENGEKTAVARTVSRQFDVVMVDEYQDTNALQALLYQCLANEDGSNLFFVGDVKQSIYRFRLASPNIFIAKRQSFTPYGTGHPATIVLGHNFRSAGNVIAQINDIFSCLMSEDVGDVRYTADEQLVQGTQDVYDGGALALKIVTVNRDNKETGDVNAVAEAIVRMVQDGFLVREKDGTTRPCRYDDFCILLRSRARFTQYATALACRKVPAFADTGENWLTSPEVSLMLSMLRIIDNPGQDIHLAAVLLSPLFHFTPDDLAALRTDAPHERLYVSLLQSDKPACKHFCAILSRLRTLAATVALEVLCTEIFACTHYFAAVGAMENGTARRENLRSFTAYAAAVAKNTSGGLAGFLYRVDNALESGAVQAGTAPPPPFGSVAIMTIHRSKGLEFPVCILADAARKFNLRDAYGSVLFHPVLGAGFHLRAGQGGLFPTAPHCAIRFAEMAESISEEMRILYVALTRAKDKLMVFFPHENPEKMLTELATGLAGTGGADAFLLAQQRSFAGWLCTAALLHPDGDALRKAAGGLVLPLRECAGHLQAQIVDADAVPALQTPPPFVRTAVPDAALVHTLQANFARQHPDAALSTLPAKLSVSAISHGDAPPVLSRPAFLYKEGLTAAERGTAQHSFLQFANLAAASQDLAAEIDRLVCEGFLSESLAQHLPQGRIETFLRSALAQRMQSADTLLREYDFITAVPAQFVADIDEAHAYQPVLIQGIADAVLLQGNVAEIVDYKTDKGKTPQQFVQTYRRQLQLYKRALEKRLNVSVKRCTIYAFDLGQEIDVDTE